MTTPLLTVSGTVLFRERIALPPGAIATVKLVDTDGEVLAASAIDATGIPTEFTLAVDPGLEPMAAGQCLGLFDDRTRRAQRIGCGCLSIDRRRRDGRPPGPWCSALDRDRTGRRHRLRAVDIGAGHAGQNTGKCQEAQHRRFLQTV